MFFRKREFCIIWSRMSHENFIEATISIIRLIHCLRRDPKWSCSGRSFLLQSGVEKSPPPSSWESGKSANCLLAWIVNHSQNLESVQAGVAASRKRICQPKGWGNRRFSDFQNCPIHLFYLELSHENSVDECSVHPVVGEVGSSKQTSMFYRCPIQTNMLGQPRMKPLWPARNASLVVPTNSWHSPAAVPSKEVHEPATFVMPLNPLRWQRTSCKARPVNDPAEKPIISTCLRATGTVKECRPG